MKLYNTLLISALAAFGGVQAQAQTARISSIALAPATGIVAVTERIGTALNAPTSVSNNLAGLAYAANNVPLTGDLANSPVSIALYAITGRTITGGALPDDFKGYGTIVAPNTSVETYIDVRGKFTSQAAFYPPGPNSYSGLVWLPVGDTLGLPGPNVFYTIHHRPSGDYFSVIVPGTSNTSDAYDLKPMSTAGVVTDPSTTGYFGLAYASVAPAAGYNANDMYFLRTAGAGDTMAPLHTVPITAGHIVFGSMVPALLSGPTDRFDLNTAVGSFGVAGYTALTFSPNDLGDGVNQFYYLRQDSTGTGNTILGRLNPSLIAGTRTIQDIANLGGVFNTLALAVAATGPASAWTTNPTLFASGAVLPIGAQSVSFAAIADRTFVGDVPFIITPTASSGQDITVTVVSGPATVVNSGTGVTRQATVTDTGTGIVKLRASQPGTGGFNANWLEQSYNVIGVPSITSASTASATVGTPFTFNLTATGNPILSYTAVGLPASLTLNTTTGVISGTPLVAATINVTGITATNATGTSTPATTLTITVSAAPLAAPVITNAPLTASGTVGTSFSFTITATNSPTSYSASPLPAGLSINTGTGAITGTPTAAGPTSVLLGATNGTGTGTATLVVTIAAAPLGAPVITNSPLTAGGQVGSSFSFTITATNSPTSYSAIPLPAGLVINTGTGAITGTPTAAGPTSVLLGATNGTGTGNATLVVTITAAPPLGSPVINNSPLAVSGKVGTAFSFTISATNSPTGFSATPLPAGLAFNASTGAITGTPSAVGVTSVLLGATNGTGTGNATLTVTVTAASVAPTVTLQPVSQTVTTGQSMNFTVAGDGERDPSETFMWQRLPAGSTTWLNLFEGGNYRGVNTSTLTVSSPTPAMTGDQFRCVILNATDFTVSNAATFTVTGGADAMFNYPASIALDASGNYYVADTAANTIRKITPTGTVSTFAGTFGLAGSQDGTGATARFDHPNGVTVDAAGNLYVTDTNNATIRKITAGGVVTTLAGTAGVKGSSDATGAAASFGSPTGIAVDSSGNLYVADTSNATIRKITSAGSVTTLAGTALATGNVNGTGAAARFNAPRGVTVSSTGDVYVADTGSATIRKITSAGVVTTMAGTAGATGTTDGLGAGARFNQPYGVFVDGTGNVYVADTGNDTIRVVTPGGAVATLAGMPGIAGLNDGAGTGAQFNLPHGLVASAGVLYVADTGNSTIRVVSVSDVVSTMSTPGTSSGATPVTPVTPVAPVTPAQSSGGGGGGAISPWALGLLALLGAARRWTKFGTRARVL